MLVITALNDQVARGADIPLVNFNISSNSINDLKQGKTDAVLLGREPTPEELQGLQDYVIAYDAVCIIIDDNSFTGGIAYGAGHPLRKETGLQNLTLDNLKDIFSGDGWQWNDGYYSYNPNLDPGSWLWNVPEIAWIPEPKPIVSAFVFPVGKYDTQSALYQSLGLNEKSLICPLTSFTSAKYNKEEEVLAYNYNGSVYSTDNGIQDFAFKLAFASRRVMTIAPQHVPVKVISIDGINPLTNPQSIYDGTYPLSRKIHVLIRDDGADSATQLVKYLQSSLGQKLLADAGYLPLSPQ